jgi:hypothetical protein
MKKLERLKMPQMSEFWSELRNALVDADCMDTVDASSMIQTRLDKYHELWPRIETTVAANAHYRRMIDRAFSVRYMLDHDLLDRQPSRRPN